MTFHILGIIIPADELIFFRGVGLPPTSHKISKPKAPCLIPPGNIAPPKPHNDPQNEEIQYYPGFVGRYLILGMKGEGIQNQNW